MTDPFDLEVTIFHSNSEPDISLYDYLLKLYYGFDCSLSAFLLSVIYMRRLLKSNTDLYLSNLTVHRYIYL